MASEETTDALPMQKALIKLQEARNLVDDDDLTAACTAFQDETTKALDALAFTFAKDLKESFEARGLTTEGRPPTLIVDPLVLNIDISAHKAQWFYGKEALTKPLSLSLGTIMQTYDQQYKRIAQRSLDEAAFLTELRQRCCLKLYVEGDKRA